MPDEQDPARRLLAIEFAALNLDLYSNDFPRRYVEEWVRGRRLGAEYEKLLQQTRLQETRATGGVTAPDHPQQGRLGTTTSDLPGLPDGGSRLGGVLGGLGIGLPSEPDEETYLKELRQQLENLFNQGGVKIGTGVAAGTDSRDPLAPGPASGGEKQNATKSELETVVAFIQFVWAMFTQSEAQRQFDKIETQRQMQELRDELARVKADLEKLKKGNPAKQPVRDDVNPGGTLSVGGMAPKKPGKPGDPLPDDQNTGPSGVLKQRDQATDPNPAAEYWGLGAPKTIRTTSDAVTDPPREPEKAGFLGRLFGGRSARG